VVIGAFIMMGINYGARYSFGVFVTPMFEEYGWSMSVISLAATISLFMYAAGGIFWGRLLDRMAPRWIMTTGVFLVALGFIVASVAANPAWLYVFYGVFCGLGASCFGVVVAGSSVGKWFVRRRGTAVGMGSVGIGLGTLIIAPMAGWVVQHFGWRTGFVTMGVAVFVLGTLVSQTLMRKSTPEEHGMYPDGITADQWRTVSSVDRSEDYSSVRSVLGDYRFWILAYCYSTGSLIVFMMFVHQVPYALEMGVDKVSAATSIGLVGFASAFGRFFYGWFSDRLRDPTYSGLIGFFFMTLGIVMLIRMTTPVGLYLYASVFGFGYGSLSTMPPVLLSRRFGRRILGSAYGTLSFFIAGIGSLGPLAGGIIYDRAGSYGIAWKINGLLALLAMVVLFFFRSARDEGL
jgi:MFS family permease